MPIRERSLEIREPLADALNAVDSAGDPRVGVPAEDRIGPLRGPREVGDGAANRSVPCLLAPEVAEDDDEVGREVGLSAAAVRKRLAGFKARVAIAADQDLEGVS